MNKTTLLSVVAVLLLLANLAMVTLMFVGRKDAPLHQRPPHHAGPRDIIIERLQFDEAQVIAYDLLIEDHRAAIRDLDRQIMDARNAIYAGLTKESGTDSDALLGQIARIQQQVEKTHVLHFADIHDLCSEEQKPLFEDMARDLAAYFSPKHPPRK
jgi:periplasmic protein CpxP/Spy